MKKTFVKHIALVLISAMLLLVFAGCETKISSSSTLNGTSLSAFSIVYADESYGYNQRAAEYIQSQIKARTGLTLPVLKDSDAAQGDNEILVGDTSRETSSRIEPVANSVQFNILAEGTRIALEGEYFVIAAAAYYFVHTYIPENNYNAQIPTEVTTHDPIVEEADNYILMIGDGMGPNQTLMFDYLENDKDFGHGEDIFFGYYLPYMGYSITNSLTGTTDSAAGGTALACGIKTNNYYVGQDKDHNPVQSLTELAATLGMATAVMSTAAATDATPAAFSSHADDREMDAYITMSQRETVEKYGTIIECNFNFFNVNGVNRICEKVTNNLNILGADPDGFFMMYEEAHIDKNNHLNNLDATFESVIRFNRVIAIVMEYAFYHPNTFVMITADHESGGLIDLNGQLVYTTEDHSSTNVQIFTYGYSADLFDDIVVENVQIPMTIATFWGINDFGDQTQYQPLP